MTNFTKIKAQRVMFSVVPIRQLVWIQNQSGVILGTTCRLMRFYWFSVLSLFECLASNMLPEKYHVTNR